MLWKPLLLGLLIRELIAPWTGHPFDFEIWVRLGAFIQTGANPYSLLPFFHGISFASYQTMTSISYPPASALLFGIIYDAYRVFGSPTPFFYYFLLKQPIVLSDLFVGVFLYELVSSSGSETAARKIATFWIYFPFGIIVSAMWGALDPIALLLILAAVSRFQAGKEQAAAFLLGLSIYLKLMPVIFLPLFLFMPPLSNRRRALFTSTALAIPLAGTLIPFLAFHWSYSGIYSAMAYQGSLPAFGGMGIFNVFSLLVLPSGPLSTAFSLAWVPAMISGYAYVLRKKAGLVESLLVVVLLFSIFRPTMPEQWAVYPIAFLLLMEKDRSWQHVLAITGVAACFLLVNNVLLVRFLSPSVPGAFGWDAFVDGAPYFSTLRYAIMLVLSTMFAAEGLSTAFGKDSLLKAKLSSVRRLRAGALLMPVAYVAVVSITGGLLDYAATKMVTDWAFAFRPGVFLGLSWLSFYHVMLVGAFEVMALLIVLFAGRNLTESVGLFFLLTFLNFISSGFSLMLYRLLEGASALATTAIYLLGSSAVTEWTFIVFANTLGLLGIFYLREIRLALTYVIQGIVQITPKLRRETTNANSLSAPS